MNMTPLTITDLLLLIGEKEALIFQLRRQLAAMEQELNEPKQTEPVD